MTILAIALGAHASASTPGASLSTLLSGLSMLNALLSGVQNPLAGPLAGPLNGVLDGLLGYVPPINA